MNPEISLENGWNIKMYRIDENEEKRREEAKVVESECAICMLLMVEPCKLTCEHHFCIRCVQSMTKQNNKVCPLCRNIASSSHRVVVNENY